MLRIFQLIAVLAVVVLFVATFGVAFYSSPYPGKPNEQKTSAEQESRNQEQEQSITSSAFWRFLFPDSISVFTFWLVLATIILAIVAVIQIGFLTRQEQIAAKTAQAAKDSADAINRQVDLIKIDQRPWIGGPIEVTAKLVGGNIIFTTIFRNVGKSPTDGFYIDAKVIDGDAINWADESAQICRDSTALAEKGFNIAPPEKNFNPYSGIPGANWAVELRDMSSSKGRTVTIDQLKAFKTPLIVGCAVYGSPFDKIIHKTGFSVRIVIEDDGAISVTSIYTVGAN